MLIPSRENIEKIFQTHQNQCAFEKCKKQIIDSDGHINGNVFFIESNIPGNPRYNSKLTKEQMIDYHNLILLSDVHGLDIEWKEKKFNISKLRDEILSDQETLKEQNFELSDKIFEDLLSHFIDYHDPDRLSHILIKKMYHIRSLATAADISCSGIYIKPTKHFVNGKFEIISTDIKIQEYDKVIFYPKEGTYSKGIQANIEIKSSMRIYGRVPDIPKGDYYVSVRSALYEVSNLENDLKFTVL